MEKEVRLTVRFTVEEMRAMSTERLLRLDALMKLADSVSDRFEPDTKIFLTFTEVGIRRAFIDDEVVRIMAETKAREAS